MNITEVRINLVQNKDDRLKAFCSITLDNEFVVRDIKIIDVDGSLFVAMPSRKICDHCPDCGTKNHLKARFCNTCGHRFSRNKGEYNNTQSLKLHADIAHPINVSCRNRIQSSIVEAFKREMELAKQQGYQPANLDPALDDFETRIQGVKIDKTPHPSHNKT